VVVVPHLLDLEGYLDLDEDEETADA
jgi:hypothetical protein